MSKRSPYAVIIVSVLLAVLWPSKGQAFCGFYVAGADSSLYANATMVVLMRDGTRTVLSIQNNYQGPPEAFALVIPVPSVLTQDQVKTLSKDVFIHVDTLGAPRLVEYWETDPCMPPIPVPLATRSATGAPQQDSVNSGVVVEAKFSVGEYDIVILSANDSSGLETWLHANEYNVPTGAKDVLAPYVAAGTKFFVAKVDVARVSFVNGQAALSPLRFYYDTNEFSLPVRLGLLNSHGTQDLIVNILAPMRYELANYPNVTIPTNIRVQNEVRDAFPGFYEALFAQLVQKNPGSVVTEYAWSANSCDPCPTPPLTPEDLATLGADVIKTASPNNRGTSGYTLTRLHYRYTKDSLGDDLVFKQASALTGGRGIPNAQGELEMTNQSAPGGYSTFQGRYVILHPWDKELQCQSPMRGRWGGPTGMGAPMTQGSSNLALNGTPPTAANLRALLAESLPDLGVTADAPRDPLKAAGGRGSTSGAGTSGAKPPSSDCSCRSIARSSQPSAAELSVGLLFALAFARRGMRRRARR